MGAKLKNINYSKLYTSKKFLTNIFITMSCLKQVA